MRLILLALLFVAGCAGAHPTDFKAYTLRLDFERGVCSGTAVGPNVLLTATHCFEGGGRLLAINGAEHYALKIVKDGKDHSLVRVTASFDKWATIGLYPNAGDRVRFLGNAAGEADMYREGYVVRARSDELLIDSRGFGGDSGAGIWNHKGQLIAVLYGGKFWVGGQGTRLDLILAWPLAFTADDWKAIR